MPVFEIGRILPGAPAEAWAALIDFPSRRIHGARYTRADLPDGPEPEPGHRIRLQIGRDRFTSVITEVKTGHSLSHRATGPGFAVEFSYRLRECTDSDSGYTSDDLGRAYLTVRADYGGWLGTLVARLRPGACRRYVADEMDAIVAAAEYVAAEPIESDYD